MKNRINKLKVEEEKALKRIDAAKKRASEITRQREEKERI
jgi:hypothetical protein